MITCAKCNSEITHLDLTFTIVYVSRITNQDGNRFRVYLPSILYAMHDELVDISGWCPQCGTTTVKCEPVDFDEDAVWVTVSTADDNDNKEVTI